MRDLRLYRAKRDPERTPEPFGGDAEARSLPPGAPRHFVVQQHAARNLHWDLRLEIEGVLVSFAVPKGPSLDPAQKRLAVQTEDHPLEYADFEGVIPAGNYGAGAMIVWDRGTYRCLDGVAPAEGLAKGKLDLELAGHKLRGRFALVRTRGKSSREWLLFTKERGFEPPDITERAPESMLLRPDGARARRGRRARQRSVSDRARGGRRGARDRRARAAPDARGHRTPALRPRGLAVRAQVRRRPRDRREGGRRRPPVRAHRRRAHRALPGDRRGARAPPGASARSSTARWSRSTRAARAPSSASSSVSARAIPRRWSACAARCRSSTTPSTASRWTGSTCASCRSARASRSWRCCSRRAGRCA